MRSAHLTAVCSLPKNTLQGVRGQVKNYCQNTAKRMTFNGDFSVSMGRNERAALSDLAEAFLARKTRFPRVPMAGLEPTLRFLENGF